MIDVLPCDEADRARVLALLRRHGWNATSFQVLERGFRYWFDGESGCVAYVETPGAWVAAGAPLAADDQLGAVTERFAAAARAHGKRFCFFAAEGRFAQTGGLRALHVGEQPVWNPMRWDETLRGSKSLREQLRRARAKGVAVRVLAADQVGSAGTAARVEIEALIRRWVGTRSMAPMGFLVDVQPFDFAEERLYLVAERNGELAGFLAAVPVYARSGWFIEDLIRDPRAPNGTAELLIDAAMRIFAERRSEYATLGLAPLSGEVPAWLRTARDRATMLYDFHGVHAFKSRLRPERWEPIYLLHAPRTSGTLALYDALAAFARGSFARFALQSVLRGPAIVVRILGALLVPWTIALAAANAHHWFPRPALKDAWMTFDLALIVGLFLLAAHWRRSLAIALASAISADALLTAAQALLFNYPRAHGLLDVLVTTVACAAPLCAAGILWSALGHRTT